MKNTVEDGPKTTMPEMKDGAMEAFEFGEEKEPF